MPARHPIQDTRDAVCLLAYLDGWTVGELAEIIGRNARTVRRWIKRAKEAEAPPDLELWMSGVGKACSHGKPIVRGMPVLCLDCMETGMPNHPAFRRGAPVILTEDEKPKPTPKFKPKIKTPKTNTTTPKPSSATCLPSQES